MSLCPHPNLELPRCPQAAGDRIDANEQIDQKTLSRLVILGRQSRTPVPQQNDLLRMKRQQGIRTDLMRLRKTWPPRGGIASQDLPEHRMRKIEFFHNSPKNCGDPLF